MMDPNNREYKNDDITVSWRPAKCIHATTCYRELIEVFNPRKRPWVDMEGAPTEKIIEIVDKCPTNALTYKWNNEEKNTETEKKAKVDEIPDTTELNEPVDIQIMKDGPVLVQGNFKIFNAVGKEIKSINITSLCRCGNSIMMPFCDGSHRMVGFKG
jgi:uncharacterized Fe-S cluster protein YjdI